MPRPFIMILLLACLPPAAHAGLLDDIGRTQLAAELGALLPKGAGIVVMQCEAGGTASPLDYLPQAGGPGAFSGSGPFAGKMFHAESGAGSQLGHANSVATYFFANGIGVADGITEIHNYDANDFLDLLTTGFTPPTFPGRVQNYSWAGTTENTADDLQISRGFDFMIDRDERIATVGLGGGSTLPPLLGSTYHAITAGTTGLIHSTTGTSTDGTGRMKPDLVVNLPFTSYAAPTIAGAAACLLQQAITNGSANARKPQTLKSILIASATKKNLPQWQRDAATEPYDDVFGAGELDLYHAWHLLQAGEQAFSTSVECSRTGWDFHTTTTNSAGRRYFFTIPAGGVAQTFASTLTWHRNVTYLSGFTSSSLPNLSLKLYAATSFTLGALISSSTSSVDNVEHLFHHHLPPGQYCLEVTSNTNNHEYALAWQSTLGSGPRLQVQRSGGTVTVSASAVDPLVSYSVETAPDLTSTWTSAHTFRTADGTPSYQHTWQDTAASPDRHFYRLRWSPVR